MNPNIMLSVLRIVAGALFVEHGTQKLLNFPPGAMHPALNTMPGAGGLIELIGGSLIVLGLFTRIVAFILSGEMAVAYFMVHFPIRLSGAGLEAKASFFPIINKGELAVLYCFVFLYLVFAGGGSVSLDAVMKRK